jgi:lauroyl/myristoyl acyltransferase
MWRFRVFLVGILFPAAKLANFRAIATTNPPSGRLVQLLKASGLVWMIPKQAYANMSSFSFFG